MKERSLAAHFAYNGCMTVLSDEQSARFFDTMDALLYYVNDRFRVVEEFTLDYDGQIGDMKTALVARVLWDNVEVIDDFVRDNPYRLPQNCLDTALAWKVALPGLYAVVRYQAGRAILMNDVGVFSVGGVTLEIEGEIGPTPAFVDVVLLPFDDGIVYDGFLQVYDGDGSAEEAARIQDEFENRCAQGIISTADEFIRVVGAHLEAIREKELEALLEDAMREASGEGEVLPAGFHRGALAGLGPLERETAIADAMRERENERVLQSSEPLDLAFDDQGVAGIADPASAARPAQRSWADIQADQAMNCAIACVLARGVEAIDDAYDHYRSLAPDPLTRDEFYALARHEASYTDSYFGIWNYQGREYLMYYTLTPDYIAKAASVAGDWRGLREELDYYESYRRGLLEARREVSPKPLSRTLLENTPLGELLRDENVERLRRFLNERIPDGQDDYSFADAAAQEFVLTSIESGSLEELYRLAEDIGIMDCCADESHLARLATNVFNAMPSWENNGWSPQELYEQLTGRRMFYNEDGTVMKVGADDLCPCGSGKRFRECCGR